MESLMDWKEALFVLGPCIKARCFLGPFCFWTVYCFVVFFLFISPLHVYISEKEQSSDSGKWAGQRGRWQGRVDLKDCLSCP